MKASLNENPWDLAEKVDCKTVGFFLKISKEIGKVWRKSLTVFSLVPDLLFYCSRILEYAKMWTVLQSVTEKVNQKLEMLWLGSWRYRKDKILNLQISEEPAYTTRLVFTLRTNVTQFYRGASGIS